MFIRTFINLFGELECLKIDIDLERERISDLIRRFTSIGSVPIITPKELNLHLKDAERG